MIHQLIQLITVWPKNRIWYKFFHTWYTYFSCVSLRSITSLLAGFVLEELASSVLIMPIRHHTSICAFLRIYEFVLDDFDLFTTLYIFLLNVRYFLITKRVKYINKGHLCPVLAEQKIWQNLLLLENCRSCFFFRGYFPSLLVYKKDHLIYMNKSKRRAKIIRNYKRYIWLKIF